MCGRAVCEGECVARKGVSVYCEHHVCGKHQTDKHPYSLVPPAFCHLNGIFSPVSDIRMSAVELSLVPRAVRKAPIF